MPKMNLKYGHVVDGLVYGHGHDVEVPEEHVSLLEEREAALASKHEGSDNEDPAYKALVEAEKNPLDEHDAPKIKEGADQKGEKPEATMSEARAEQAKPKAR
jgi:hypothetical protein